MIEWNSYIETKVQDLLREAKNEHMIKEAITEKRQANTRRSPREFLGEQMILIGWRMMNRLPAEGETCSRLVLSGHKQAIVMVEVCV
jgi:hypothetical protein